ncbi:Cytochrome P450 monooxygenase fsdH [Lachnellula suecica]|uniref:Cytochrome P450 monooxygenase fsdH n=1 Tax=Lachnellula suecica TaxID=602035 RepID=A0A8T9BX99_9HELO|nr:Cytochrome P450 monooxygenase fsdH [Lachnellula suecica]
MWDILSTYSPRAIAAALLICYAIYALIARLLTSLRYAKISRQHGCKPIPSYPHRDPIFGIDMFFRSIRLSKEGGFLEDMRDRHENVIGNGRYTFTQLVQGDRMILTAEPENIKTILATKFRDYEYAPRRKAAFYPIFGHGIFANDGADWEASRALLRPSFTRDLVGDLDVFEVHISNLIAKIPKDGSTVDLQTLFFHLTMDSATDFLFGDSTNVLGSGDSAAGERFADAFSYGTFKAGLQARVGWIVTLWPDKKLKDDVDFIHQYVANYVQKAVNLNKEGKLDEKASKYVFLEQLAKTRYPERKIQDELLNTLLAGRDTTASLLAYFFWYLARRPDVWANLKGEIEGLGEQRPSFEEIKGMKYLQWCLNETLRLHPIVPVNGRYAIRDTVLPVGGGPDGKSPILVKKGTSINYQVYVMHRRKDLYGEDSDEFKPERWEALRPGWQYLPFNGGPRICLGQQFALTEASYTVIRLLQAFKSIEKRDDSKIDEYLTLTAAVRGGVHVGMKPV